MGPLSTGQQLSPHRDRRSLAPFRGQVFDLLVIGGGITGACIARDAARRGLSTALVEKGDFASGTTQATSRLIHGGLRYLKNGEIGLVRESLRERRLLARIAPHAVRPEGFLLPVYRGHGHGPLALQAALGIYDLLAFDRNRGLKDGLKLPGARWMARTDALALEPGLSADGLRGAFLYYDYANLNPERLAVEMLLDAVGHGALARNYLRCAAVKHCGANYSARLLDELSGQSVIVEARSVVNASGPWADYLDNQLLGRIDRPLLRSKGIHLVVRRVVNDRTVALMAPDGRHLFLIPWHGRTLVGTTDSRFEDHPDRLGVTADDARGVLDEVNALFPGAALAMQDVQYFYGGLRPLVDDGGSSYSASRRAEIYEHSESGNAGFFTVLGGKYTTSRGLAEKAVDRICGYLPGDWPAGDTDRAPLPGGEFESIEALSESLRRGFPEIGARAARTLSGRYGRIAESMLAMPGRKQDNEEFASASGELYYAAEIDWLVQKEGVEQLSDLVFRRTAFGLVGRPPELSLRRLAERVGRLLQRGRGWVRQSIRQIEARYQFSD